ncbi:flap endonuclease-1 [Sulfolobales archaeon HS-7]|nr:flap endonuclease-1 [Sulfolobales archaeon HS-7]
MLYQFLAAIRQPDGTPLKNLRGEITSHLSGVFYRTINLVEEGITPVFVFDGKPPELKKEEIENRRKVKEEAQEKYEMARKEGDIRSMRKYAQATNYLSSKMAGDAKRLLKSMGIPYVQAPAEGEAEAAYLNTKGYSWGAVSQDYDSLLFGASRLIRNLAITGKRKLPNKDVYVEVKVEEIDIDTLLKELGITREQLIDLAILIGTDYNPEGVKGIGPKTALKLIKKHGNIDNAIKSGEVQVDFDPRPIRSLFLNPDVKEPEEKMELGEINKEEILKILVNENDFNQERVEGGIERLTKAVSKMKREGKQQGLDKWF